MAAESLAVLTKCVEPLIKDLYNLGKTKFLKEVAPLNVKASIRKLTKHLIDVRKVKTIWQIDKEVLITDFYYPSKVIINDKPVVISAVNKLPDYEGIILAGTAGQGKSILLRFLCFQEIKQKIRIPIFIQFRHIDESETIIDQIINELDIWGIKPTGELIKFLFDSGIIILLLDGFDELAASKVSSIIKELDSIRIKHPSLKIVITSRPNSGIEKSPHFRINMLAELKENDIPHILKKLVYDDTKDHILKDLTGNKNIISLLKTPLIVTILVITYKTTQKIPSNSAEFYENLFHTMFTRHDSSKPGFIRARSTDITERQFHDAFNALCFICRKNSLVNLTLEQFLKYCEEAFRLLKIQCDPNKYIEDLTKITCLVIEEGHEYFFIHKSVEEYHAACFLRNRNDDIIKSFYVHMKEYRWLEWMQELIFLSQIDRYRFFKYLIIPDFKEIQNFFGFSDLKWHPMTKDKALKFAEACTLSAHVLKENNSVQSLSISVDKNLHSWSTGFTNQFYKRPFQESLYDSLEKIDNFSFENLHVIIKKLKIKSYKEKKYKTGKHVDVNLFELFNKAGVLDNSIKMLAKNLDDFGEKISESLEYVKNEEALQSVVLDIK